MGEIQYTLLDNSCSQQKINAVEKELNKHLTNDSNKTLATGC